MVARPYPPTRQRTTRKPHSLPKYLPYFIAIVSAICVGILLVAIVVGVLSLLYMMEERIPDGVTVAGVSVANLEPVEAENLVRGSLGIESITLTDGLRQWDAPLYQLGITFDYAAMFERMRTAQRDEQIPPIYVVDLGIAQQGLVDLSGAINIAAEPGVPGRALEIPVMLDRLRTDVVGEINDGVFELNMMDTEPLRITADNYTGDPITHEVQAGQELALIAKEYGIDVEDILDLNNISNPDLLYIGQQLKIPAPGVYEPTDEEAPPAPLQNGKSIVVSTDEQRIYAYENGELMRSHLTSTGRAQTPTVKGDYNIYIKHEKTNMSGPDYFLPDVPYTMYFYQGYGIHGTYWHNSFGRPMSHGCVNLPIDEARWFFNWANEGTLVRVI